MRRNEYSAGSVSYTFWFLEFKKTVQLLNEGKTFEEIKKLSEDENLYGAPTKARAKNIYSATSRRIQALDSSFIPLFLESDLATQKQFVLAADLAFDTLFFDFVYEVVREKMIIGSCDLTDLDIMIFFRNKQEQSYDVAKYTDETLSRLKRSYKTRLYEAGMLDSDTRAETRKILKPILETSIRNWLIDYGYEPIAKALEGIR